MTSNGVPSLPPINANGTQVTPGTSARKRKGKSRKQPPKAIAIGLDAMPAWMKVEAAEKALVTREKRTMLETTKANALQNFETDYRVKKYNNIFKAATIEYKEHRDSGEFKKRGKGATAIAKKYNELHLDSPGDRQIKVETLREAVVNGRAGITPVKMGRPPKIPEQYTKAMAIHATMLQVSGEGEACKQNMLSTSRALTAGTVHEGEFNHEYAVRKMRKVHANILLPAKAKNNEDRRVEWCTYRNIMSWTDAVKKYLVDIGMLSDEPGLIREYLIVVHQFYFSFLTMILLCMYITILQME